MLKKLLTCGSAVWILMYSVFPVIFEKRIFIGLIMKFWKVRNHLQVNIIKQNTPLKVPLLKIIGFSFSS